MNPTPRMRVAQRRSFYIDKPLVGFLVALSIAQAGGTLRDPRHYPAIGRPAMLRLVAGSSR